MELHQLECFLAVADCGTVTAAAAQLYLTQSALSRVIQRLERELGVPLFDRHGRRLTLNADGELFQFYIAGAMQQIRLGVRAIQTERPVGGSVAIRCELIRGLLERVFRQCSVRFPQLEFAVTRWSEDAGDGAPPDLWLTAEPPEDPTHAASFLERWCFLAARTAPGLAPELSVTAIGRLPLVLYGTPEDERFVRSYFRSHGLRPNLVCTRDPKQPGAMIEAGLALGCIPLRFFLENWTERPDAAPYALVFASDAAFERPIWRCAQPAFLETAPGREIVPYLDDCLREISAQCDAFVTLRATEPSNPA